MEGEGAVRFGFPPRHGRENVSDWQNVGAGTHEHADYRRYDQLLQEYSCRRVLAMVESVF